MPATLAAEGSNELLALFTRYNQDWWPVHVLTYALGVGAVLLLFSHRRQQADVMITGVLAVLWLWQALVFQAAYATDVDVVLGWLYAALFALQAYLFGRAALRRDLAYRVSNGAGGLVGWAAIGYAVVAYPLLGAALDHGWPESPLLGMAPCPTTILTFGLLLLATPPIPHRLLVVPLVWALLAPPAALDRGVYEDLGLLVVGITATAWILLRDRRLRRMSHAPDEFHPATSRVSS